MSKIVFEILEVLDDRKHVVVSASSESTKKNFIFTIKEFKRILEEAEQEGILTEA